MKYDYDLIVLGGGAAGLVAATAGASLGAKTALIEKNKLGGDCTWFGCIPSKTLLKSAQVYSLIKRLEEFGVSVLRAGEYDTSMVMSHVRDIIQKVSTHHPPEVFEKRGIRVVFGDSKFIDNKTIELKNNRITSKRFIICTGSRPLVPPIDGLKDINYLTNETIFDLEALPKSMAILGGGPIGVELSQALSRLGVEVSIIEMVDRILFREDEEVAKVLTDRLIEEGIKIYAGKKAVKFSPPRETPGLKPGDERGFGQRGREPRPSGRGGSTKIGDLIEITVEDKNRNQSIIKARKILVAVGRQANVGGLELEKAGVKYSNKGIEADKTLKTVTSNIYVAGDVVGPYQFSHMAEYQAIIAAGNALFPFKRKVNYNTVPWCTFTEPELAHVGLTEEEARKEYKDIKVYRSQYSANDRAVTDLEEAGFAKVICDKKGRILGAHIVGANAGEIIHEYALAKSSGLKIGNLSSAIHIYPALAQVVKRSADQYYLDMLNSTWLRVFFRLMLKFFLR